MKYAHSVQGKPSSFWEPLDAHLQAVGRTAGRFAQPFDAVNVARAAGLLHDLGKAKPAFQAYLRGECPSAPHSGEGARFASERLGTWGKLIAYGIAGHHAGLPNGLGHSEKGRPQTPLAERLKQAELLDLPEGISLPDIARMPAPLAGLPNDDMANFRLHFFTRMVFSALVDADFLETEAFYDRVEGRRRPRGWQGSLDDLAAALNARLAAFGPPEGRINRLRAEILRHVRGMAGEPPGLFTLTVPTGGGKTLTSLAFALDHARRHGLERVIYVIPYTSIVEQTADVFRQALQDHDAVLEHHASFDWDGVEDPGESERLKLAAQNWDRPVIVTTAVQFFESLFANRPSKCRKLHRLARSVIVLDEAQTLPLRLLRPCLAAMQELVRGYGASIVLCTATQPALLKGREGDGFPAPEGLEPDAVRELAPDPPRLYEEFRRVTVRNAGEMSDAALAERLLAREQVLAIVNSTEHARALFERLRGVPGAFHLSTRMTARHRRHVLARVRERLQDGQPVRLVSTSLIEAGVDVDFPEVWRQLAGIDSIAQAAGRCNREGRREKAEVFVFTSSENFPAPRDLEQFASVAAEVLRDYPDPLSLEAVRAYFRHLFRDRGPEALDAARVGGVRGILKALADSGPLNFPFADIAAAFRMIDGGVPLIIRGGRWGLPAEEEQKLRHQPHAGAIARALQRYQVQVPPRRRTELLEAGAAEVWRGEEFGDQFVLLCNERLYDPDTGLMFEDSQDLGGMIF